MTTQPYLGHASAPDGGSIAARLRRGGRGWQDIHSEAFFYVSWLYLNSITVRLLRSTEEPHHIKSFLNFMSHIIT